MSESERMSQLLEMVETSIAVTPGHGYAVHSKSEGQRAGVIDFRYRDQSQLPDIMEAHEFNMKTSWARIKAPTCSG
jgi:hypothetical protein